MPDKETIVKLVRDQESSQAWMSQRDLMDDAYSLWSLEQYLSIEGKRALAGLAHYTSNDPRTFADMTVAMLSQARLIISIPLTDQQQEERDVDAQKERFAIGILKAGDERLDSLLLPNLQDALAWQAAIRGRLACRFVLAKNKDGRTYVDIMPWDSRYVFWGRHKGMNWRCHKVWKTLDEIEAEYEISMDSEREKVGTDGLEVYDFYDDKQNMVCTAEKDLKKGIDHGSPRVPVVMSFVGQTLPLALPTGGGQMVMRGQDIYHALRETYKLENFLLGAHASRVKWEVNPNWTFESKMGDKNLEENPLQGTGTGIALAEGEKLEIPKLPEVSREAMTLEAQAAMRRQKGSFSDVVTGMAPYPMSGVAIDRYRQPVEMVISPCQKAIESIFRQGIRLLCDQYAIGAFPAMEVSGTDRKRRYFKATISSEIVGQGGEIEVRMIPSLPRDDASRMALFQASRQPDATGVPGVSHRFGLENYLQLDDVDLEMSAIMNEMAKRFSPWALADEMIKAAAKQGDEDKVRIYVAEALIAMRQKQMQLAQLGLKVPEGNGNRPQGLVDRLGQPLNKGFSPTVLHGAQVGNPPGYNPAVGPQVPAGTPRPGDLNEEQRAMLESMGMPPGMG